MRPIHALCSAACLLLVACTPAPPAAPASAGVAGEPQVPAADAGAPAEAHANFRCGEQLVGALFDNRAGTVVLTLGGRRVELAQAVSASGARYTDAAGNTFWNKGDEASLTLDGGQLDCRETAEVSPWDEARARGVAFRGLGTEPFWSLEVDGGEAPEMRLDLDMGERRLLVAGAAPLDEGEGWSGSADDGSAVTLRVTRGDCSDGMSDMTYPATVELQVGEEAYRGCGAFLDR